MERKGLSDILRIILAVFLIVSAGDVFFHYTEPSEPPVEAQEFLISLTAAGYVWPAVGFGFLISGILLFTPRLVGLALVVLAPITVNIILYHLFLDRTSPTLIPASMLVLLHLAVAGLNRGAFRSLFRSDS